VRQVLTEGGSSSLAERLQPGSILLDTTSSVPSGPISHMTNKWMAEALQHVDGERDHPAAFGYWEQQPKRP